MGAALEGLRAEAEAFSDASEHQAAGNAWKKLALAALDDLDMEPRVFAAMVRMSRQGVHAGEADAEDVRFARAAAAALSADLGAGHPEAIFASETAAAASAYAGDPAAAVSELERVEALSREALGPGHRQTVSAARRRGFARGLSGDWKGAAAILDGAYRTAARELGEGHPDASAAAVELAFALAETGDWEGARGLLEDACARFDAHLGPDHRETLTAASNLGHVISSLGDYAAARALLGRVLEARLRTLGPEHEDSLVSRNNLASVASELGDFAGARDQYRLLYEARDRTLGPEHPDTILALNNLGGALLDLGEVQAARECVSRALAGMEKAKGPGHRETLEVRNNHATVLERAGDLAGARDEHRRILAEQLRTLGEDHPDVMDTRNKLAFETDELGDFEGARDMLFLSLESASRLYGRDHHLAAMAAMNLGRAFARRGRLAEGIFYMKLSVAAAQGARGMLGQLDDGLRRSYLRRVEDRYHWLFSLLMKAGRREEALEVLGLLKEDELSGLEPAEGPGPRAGKPEPALAGAAAGPDGSPGGGAYEDVLFSRGPDGPARAAFLEAAANARALQVELDGLGERGAADGPDGEGGRRMAALEARAAEAKEAFLAVLAGLPELLGTGGAGGGGAGHGVAGAPEGNGGTAGASATGLLAAARRGLAGRYSGEALVFALSAPDALYLVAVTAGGVSVRESPVGRDELEGLALEFRGLVQDPSRDPRVLGKRLHELVIAPVEADLEAAGAATLMLSLDGALRYVPVSALWDGERWLAEKYPSVVFTRSTLEGGGDGDGEAAGKVGGGAGAAPPSARALGVTAAWPGFAPLHGVAAEIEAVVGAEGRPGALPGEGFLDADFTRESLAASLSSGAPVVHIASHFRLDPSSNDDTVLLLGDGGTLSLSEFRSSPDLGFGGLDLLTLSACDSGSGSRGRRDGREVESLGETLQRAGARTVLATLLPVDDMSAPEIMREFYRLRYSEGKDKAEALRGAQIAVMRNETAVPAPARGTAVSGSGEREAGGGGGGGTAPRWEGKGYSHPYFWAPFVVMGDWK
jgi:CHAT domain-containing protein/tetratricopeptide (TPR) repeat protein